MRTLDSVAIKFALTLILVLCIDEPLAAGHGFVQTVIVAESAYLGYDPFSDPYASSTPERVIRKIPSDGPITNDQDQDLACNVGGEGGAGLVASAPAGSVVMFEWTNWPADHLGPVSTYMTSCGSDCTDFDVKGAEWFKLDADGYSDGQWASAKLISNNNTWTSTIPSALAPGQYLMRNEIVALHSSAPQYYPSCTQVEVTSGGSAQASSDETTKIPGLYTNVEFPDIWTDTFDSWTAPGPAVVSFADNSDNQNSDASGTLSAGGGRPSQNATPGSGSADDGSGIPAPQCRLMGLSLTSQLARRSIVTRLRSFPSDFFFVLHTFTHPNVRVSP